MSILLSDRVQEISSTTGTGPFALTGAVTGYTSFAASFTDGDEVYYTIDNTSGEWEVGYGVYNTNQISRDAVLSSSNSGNLVDFSVGSKRVFCSLPADSFLQAGAGAVNRQAQSKMRDIVNVADFGVIGDGSDETDKLQAAFNAAAGQELWFENGKTYSAYILRVQEGTIVNLNGSTIQKIPYDAAALHLYQVTVRGEATLAWSSTTRYYIDTIATQGGVWYQAIRPTGNSAENINRSPNANPDWWEAFTPESTMDANVFWSVSPVLGAPLLYIKGDNVTIKNGVLDGNRANETYLTDRWGGSFAVEGNRALIAASSSELIVASNFTSEGIYNLTIEGVTFQNAYGTCIVTEWIKQNTRIENCTENNSGNIFSFNVGEVAYWGSPPNNVHTSGLAGNLYYAYNYLSGPRGNGNVLNPGIVSGYENVTFIGNIVNGVSQLTSGGWKSGAQRAIFVGNTFINEFIKPQYGQNFSVESLVVSGNNFSSDNPYTHGTGVSMGIHATKHISITGNNVLNGGIGLDYSAYTIDVGNNTFSCSYQMVNPGYGTAAAYNASTTYAIGDTVSYGVTYYYSLVDSNIGNQPDLSLYRQWIPLNNAYISIGGSESALSYWSAATTYPDRYLVQYQGLWYEATHPAGNTNPNINHQPDINPEWWIEVAPYCPVINITNNTAYLGSFPGNNFFGPPFALNTLAFKNNTIRGADRVIDEISTSVMWNEYATIEISDNHFSFFRFIIRALRPSTYTPTGTAATYTMKRFVFNSNVAVDQEYYGADLNLSTGGVGVNLSSGSISEIEIANNYASFGNAGGYNQYLIQCIMSTQTLSSIQMYNNNVSGITTNANAYAVLFSASSGSSVGSVCIYDNVFSDGKALYINGFTTTTKYAYNNFIGYAILGNVFPSHKSTALITGNFATTVGAAGGASALPATPVGYIEIDLDHTTYKVPYYTA